MSLADTLIEQVLNETAMDSLVSPGNLARLKMSQKLRLIYELEYKYHKIKHSPAPGPRPQNVLKRIESSAKDLIKDVVAGFMGVFDSWLGFHRHDEGPGVDPEHNERVWLRIHGQIEKMSKELKLYLTDDVNIIPEGKEDDFHFLAHDEDVNKAVQNCETANYWFYEFDDDEREMVFTALKTLAKHNPKYRMLKSYSDTERMEDHEVVMELIRGARREGVTRYLFTFETSLVSAAEKVYEEELFRLAPDTARNETFQEVQSAYQMLQDIHLNGSLGTVFAEINHCLNVYHNSGSMMEYINQEFPDVDTALLSKLSNLSTKKWDKELEAERLIQ